MKKQINSATRAHLVRGALYLLLFVALYVVPFTLGQQWAGAPFYRKNSTVVSKYPSSAISTKGPDFYLGQIYLPLARIIQVG